MCDEMENAKKFKAAINRTFSEHGGVFWQGISDQQLTTYNMDLMDDFATNDGRVILGSLVIGRQPNPRKVDENGQFVDDDNINPTPKEMDDYDSAVYIINEKLQVDNIRKICQKYPSISSTSEYLFKENIFGWD